MNINVTTIIRRTILVILFIWYLSCNAQVTTRKTVSSSQDISIVQTITSGDTLFTMLGQNAEYQRIIDILVITSGSAGDIYDLLSQCILFLNQNKGSSMSYGENNLLILGNGQLAIWSDDRHGYITLRKNLITKFQTDLLKYVHQ